MKNKKIILGIAIAVVIFVGLYFGVLNRSDVPTDVPTLEEGFGIWESEIMFADAEPGCVDTAPLTIICGKDSARNFTVSIEQPRSDKLKDGYAAFPEDYYSWITLPEAQPIVIEAGGYRTLDIQFAVPTSANYSGQQMEARIRVSEINLTGLIQLALESRWYIVIAEQ